MGLGILWVNDFMFLKSQVGGVGGTSRQRRDTLTLNGRGEKTLDSRNQMLVNAYWYLETRFSESVLYMTITAVDRSGVAFVEAQNEM